MILWFKSFYRAARVSVIVSYNLMGRQGTWQALSFGIKLMEQSEKCSKIE